MAVLKPCMCTVSKCRELHDIDVSRNGRSQRRARLGSQISYNAVCFNCLQMSMTDRHDLFDCVEDITQSFVVVIFDEQMQ